MDYHDPLGLGLSDDRVGLALEPLLESFEQRLDCGPLRSGASRERSFQRVEGGFGVACCPCRVHANPGYIRSLSLGPVVVAVLVPQKRGQTHHDKQDDYDPLLAGLPLYLFALDLFDALFEVLAFRFNSWLS